MERVFARWVLQIDEWGILSADGIFIDIILYCADPDNFITRFVIQDECWIYHFEPECKIQCINLQLWNLLKVQSFLQVCMLIHVLPVGWLPNPSIGRGGGGSALESLGTKFIKMNGSAFVLPINSTTSTPNLTVLIRLLPWKCQNFSATPRMQVHIYPLPATPMS